MDSNRILTYSFTAYPKEGRGSWRTRANVESVAVWALKSVVHRTRNQTYIHESLHSKTIKCHLAEGC